MTLHAINQAALVKSTDNSGNSCNMRVKCYNYTGFVLSTQMGANNKKSSKKEMGMRNQQ